MNKRTASSYDTKVRHAHFGEHSTHALAEKAAADAGDEVQAEEIRRQGVIDSIEQRVAHADEVIRLRQQFGLPVSGKAEAPCS